MALWQSLNTLSKNFDDPASIEARYAVREILALRQKIAELAAALQIEHEITHKRRKKIAEMEAERGQLHRRANELEESIGWLANEPWYIGITQEDAKEIALALANVLGDAEPKPLSNRLMLKWPVSARRAIMERDITIDELRAKVAELEKFARDISDHRESCQDYDRDMGYEPREFSDDEEWERIEEQARDVLKRGEE